MIRFDVHSAEQCAAAVGHLIAAMIDGETDHACDDIALMSDAEAKVLLAMVVSTLADIAQAEPATNLHLALDQIQKASQS